MTITFSCAFLNCTCVNKFGTVTTAKNYFWSSINPNIAVKVPFITTCPRKSLMNTVLLSISITTVMPSVLDEGPQILLANILTPERLICTHASDMAHPVPSHDYVLVNRSILCNCHMESGLTYLLKSIAFCETASADYTMSFALNLAFLHMIQDLWPRNFSQLPPVITQEELAFPLGLTSNAEFRGQDPNGTYPILLMHEPQSLAALCSSLRAQGAAHSDRKSPFSFGPRQAYPI